MKYNKKIFHIFAGSALIFFFMLAGINNSQTKYKFVGVNTCVGACHKTEAQGNQLDIWRSSKHAEAFTALETPFADSIAKANGYNTPASETPQCVKCHLLGKETDESEFTGSFDKSQGVQCESCHGPGSEYRKTNVMKDKNKALENGLIIHTDKELFCIQCHNRESPTYFEFDYDQMWKMIAHYKPLDK